MHYESREYGNIYGDSLVDFVLWGRSRDDLKVKSG